MSGAGGVDYQGLGVAYICQVGRELDLYIIQYKVYSKV